MLWSLNSSSSRAAQLISGGCYAKLGVSSNICGVPVMRIRVFGGLVAYIGNLSFMETTKWHFEIIPASALQDLAFRVYGEFFPK